MAEMPRTFLTSLVFAVITYWMAGLREEADAFFTYVAIIFLVGLRTPSFFSVWGWRCYGLMRSLTFSFLDAWLP